MAAKAELIPGGVEEIIQDSPLNPLSLHTIMKDRNVSKYTCIACKYITDKPEAVLQHVNTERHFGNIHGIYTEMLLPLLERPTEFDELNLLIENNYKINSAKEVGQMKLRAEIVRELEENVQLINGNVSLEVVGSTGSGLCLTTSDININVNINEPFNESMIPDILLSILTLLHKNVDVYTNVKEDFYSPLKVPKITFKHKSSGILCELRAGTFAPQKLSSLLSMYSKLDSRLNAIATALHYIINVLKCNNQIDGHYPSVVFHLLIIHYLQQTTPPLLPVIHELLDTDLEREEGGAFINKDEFNQYLVSATQNWTGTNTQTVGQLFYGLLRYYIFDFNASLYAVSVRQFELLTRSSRGWGKYGLAVEDPIIPKSNIARASSDTNVSDYLLDCFKLIYFQLNGVSSHIDLILSSSAVLLNQSVQSTTHNTNPTVGPPDPSIGPVDPSIGPVDPSIVPGEVSDATGDIGNTGEGEGEGDDDDDPLMVETGEDETISKRSNSSSSSSGKRRRRRLFFKPVECQEILKLIKSINLPQEEKCPIDEWIYLPHFKRLIKSCPVTCILCRRKGHSALKCPNEIVPKLTHEVSLPPNWVLRKVERLFIEYMESVMLKSSEIKERNEIKDLIQNDVRKLYKNSRLELFGSSSNGFGHSQSDLDLCLIIDDEQTDKVQVIEDLVESFKADGKYKHVVGIKTARVPIVKLTTIRCNIDADISLLNSLALHNTEMLAAYNDIDCRLKPLGFILKHFAKVCDMCDASSGSISSYAFIIMMIHYLQQLPRPVLPVLQQLGDRSIGPVVNDWNCYYFKDFKRLSEVWKPVERNGMSVAQLWIGFLKYYSMDFDWSTDVVTIRQLDKLTKFEKWWTSKYVAIEDPFNLEHNLGQAVSSRMRTYMLMRFQRAYKHHTKPKNWNNLDDLISGDVLCGKFKAPKFMICDKCSSKGHRAESCTSTGERGRERNDTQQQQQQQQQQEQEHEIKRRDGGREDVGATGGRGRERKHVDEIDRNDVLKHVLSATKNGSFEELKKLKQFLKPLVYTKHRNGNIRHKIELSVVNELLKKHEATPTVRTTPTGGATPTSAGSGLIPVPVSAVYSSHSLNVLPYNVRPPLLATPPSTDTPPNQHSPSTRPHKH